MPKRDSNLLIEDTLLAARKIDSEMLIKVLNGCVLNQHFWIFDAATTNVRCRRRERANATAWLRAAGPSSTDGVVAKRLDSASVGRLPWSDGRH